MKYDNGCISSIDFGEEALSYNVDGLLGGLKEITGLWLDSRQKAELFQFLNEHFTTKEMLHAFHSWEKSEGDTKFCPAVRIDNVVSFLSTEQVGEIWVMITIEKDQWNGCEIGSYEWDKKGNMSFIQGKNVTFYVKGDDDRRCKLCAADGTRVRFDRFSRRNLFEALLNIGYLPEKEAKNKFVDVVAKKIRDSFAKLQNDKESGEEMVLETGLKLRLGCFDIKDCPEISLFLKRNSTLEYDVRIGFGKKRYCVKECVKPLYQEVDCMAVYYALQDLALNKAAEEDWSFNGHPYGALKYYLESVFSQLKADEKKNESWAVFSKPRDKPEDLVFCTGLVTPKDQDDREHFIYAHCFDLEDGVYQSIEWLFRKDNKCLEQIKSTTRANNGLPYPPNWVGDPERLLFDYRYGSICEKQIQFNYSHIFDRLKERWDEGEMMKFKSCEDKEFIEFLDAAWRRTRKLLHKNFKVAVPTYYKEKIQLLVPLYLDKNRPNDASVAMVVALNDDPDKNCYYFCPTCLNLDQARMNSRVITRIDDTWLQKHSVAK